jgi:nucleoside-diphosphate-sugar epimerase
VYNVGSSHEVSVRDVVNEIIIQSDRDVTVNSDSAGRSSSIEIDRMVADVSKLQELSWDPEYDVEHGIKATLKQFE